MRNLSARRQGMALVVILALLVLITAVVMAFFVHATSNRMIESSRSNQTAVALLGTTASEYVAGRFLEEITSPDNNTADSTNGIYFPKTTLNAGPQRLVTPSLATDMSFATLIRQSIVGADTNASEDNVSTAAKNGRAIGLERWNLPQLLPGAGFTSTTQLPKWIYVTEQGPTNAISSAVIGRFAYNVYQVGGLLNINATGYPSGVSPSSLRGSSAGADLSQLSVPNTAINSLVAFRNQINGTYTNIAAASAAVGFLSLSPTNAAGTTVATNNYFTSRQDMLRYAQTQNIALTNALPYLTHFSRALNAPSWNATTNSSTNEGLLLARVPPDTSSIVHYRDVGTQDVRDVTPNTPLLQTRFSLARLAWLTHTGPATATLDEAIQSCFGLRWDSSTSRWIYAGNTGSVAKGIIKTLSQVAAEKREPDFFEVLKSVILSGSLGLGPGTGTAGSINSYYDGQKDAQIIQIGANIIDQYDADSYPTAIYFPAVSTVPGTSMPSNIFNTYFGIENLPYLSRLYAIALNTGKMGAWIQPQFWNPHQSPVPGVGLNPPTNFRVKTYGQNSMRWKQTQTPPIGDFLSSKINYSSTDASKGIVYFGTTKTDYRDTPQVLTRNILTATEITETDPKNLWQTGYPFGTSNPFAAIFVGETSAVPKQFANNNANNAINTYAIDEYHTTKPEVTVTVEYWDGSQWLPYNSMACLKKMDSNQYADIRGWDIGISFLGRIDPRTDRFSSSLRYTSSQASLSTTFQPDASTRFPVYKMQPNASGFAPAPVAGVDTYIGDWAKNTTGGSARYTDPDGIIRPGDAFRASGTEGNPLFHGSPASGRRPVVLNRPFLSVGELGYAYRDLPFKSLDFSSDQSADSGLLDVFSLVDEPVITAGSVDLSAAPAPVLQALLGGTVKEVYSSAILSDSDASAVASAVTAAISADGPLVNRRDLVNRLSTAINGALTTVADKANKNQNEAIVRSLASLANTRTWNFLIDVAAQSGRLPASAAPDPSLFLVEGERRYWLHIAIDRYTGKIVDQQLELVSE